MNSPNNELFCLGVGWVSQEAARYGAVPLEYSEIFEFLQIHRFWYWCFRIHTSFYIIYLSFTDQLNSINFRSEEVSLRRNPSHLGSAHHAKLHQVDEITKADVKLTTKKFFTRSLTIQIQFLSRKYWSSESIITLDRCFRS